MKKNLIVEDGQSFQLIKKSKFFGHAVAIESENQFHLFMKEYKITYKGATHFCFAYRFTDRTGCLREKMSDDKEPYGTAGIPMLSLLQNESITNGCIIVIRFFGGVKLGKKGLLNAYLGTANDALKKAKVKEFVPTTSMKLSIQYSAYDFVSKEFKQFQIEVIEVNYGTSVDVILQLPIAQKKLFLNTLEQKNLINYVTIL